MTVYGTATYNGTSYTLYGFPGSTLRDELNRLANGGEYPSRELYQDENGAANTWIGTPKGTPLTSALNRKIDPNRPYTAYKGNNAAACEIAGITDPAKYIEIVTALRTVAS